ncbi:MAG: hypothetical protein DPW18_18200 [Chloroflexi bacterium]|nr:hypothetical protein [Chloroflexota bacterium]MDL1942205.1 hypothetical protein [Chloroflexi bacterium CFX2]
MKKDKDEIVYYITVSDVQEVAGREIGRELSREEIELILDRIGENIPWYDAISASIDEIIRSGTKSLPTDYNSPHDPPTL